MRDKLIRTKFWLYRYSGLLTTGVVAAVGGLAVAQVIGISAAATALASVLGIGFGVQKQKHNEFNGRYDALDDGLRKLAEVSGDQAFSTEERDTLIRYFNLCAEEFFYYTHGCIHPEAWASWRSGMEEIFSNPKISALWSMEAPKQSYYGLELHAPFGATLPAPALASTTALIARAEAATK